MKVAYITMGPFNKEEDFCQVHDQRSALYGVRTMEEAIEVAQRLQAEGVDSLELCGAFKEEGARTIIEATGHTMPVGYVVHFPEQDPMYEALFPKKKKK